MKKIRVRLTLDCNQDINLMVNEVKKRIMRTQEKKMFKKMIHLWYPLV